MNNSEVRDEINKRLTLNWLIQGAAQHAGMTSHHLIQDELNAIHPKLLRLYDQYALINLLQYWSLESVILLGSPSRFWKGAMSNPRHPFFGHPLLSRYGGMLAATAKKRALARCQEKGFTCNPVVFPFQAGFVMGRLDAIEASNIQELIPLAKKTTAMVWGISKDRLNADLTRQVAFGNLSRPQTLRGRILRKLTVGYGGVMCCDDTLQVVARGTNWYLLSKELVKGTAELICLHGLNTLRDDSYQQVMYHADRIEFEPWMLQTGGELWRCLLALLPNDSSLAVVLMHLARLPAKPLESLILAVIEQPEWARELLAGLGAPDADLRATRD